MLDFAAAHQWLNTNNPARWRGHLDKLLPRPTRVPKVRHHPAMPYDEVGAFMDELRSKTSVSACALRFLILTATRSGEVLHAEWSEIDLNNNIWTTPESRMKAGREHRVSLTEECMSILAAVPRIKNNPYVFWCPKRASTQDALQLTDALTKMIKEDLIFIFVNLFTHKCVFFLPCVYWCVYLNHRSKTEGLMKSKDVRKMLERHGCCMKRQGKGDHEIWFSPITGKTFPVPHPKQHIPVGTLKSIKRLAGI